MWYRSPHNEAFRSRVRPIECAPSTAVYFGGSHLQDATCSRLGKWRCYFFNCESSTEDEFVAPPRVEDRALAHWLDGVNAYTASFPVAL